MKRTGIRWPFVLIIIIAAIAMFYAGKTRLHIDTDITSSLPVQDQVILDSRLVMMHHPMKDRIVIDLSHNKRDVDLLADGARFIEKKLTQSGLFSRVGMSEYMETFPSLVSHIVENLPLLFTEKELEHTVRPLLSPERIRESMSDNYSRLLNLDGIGQSRMMSADPLGFRNLVLSRLTHLAPSRNVQFSQGHMVSSDGRHVLIMAEPRGSGSDTALARRIASLLFNSGVELNRKYKMRDVSFTLTPVGAYRAALDNEEAARKDARNAVIFATIGIALLLLVGFPRPFIGLLALAPALLGTIAAAFVYSLFSGTISILAIGFGSTIISFTVDYGIAYLLFLDRPSRTHGFGASREVWSLGLLAMLTTAVSFSFLFISGFSALAQIGYFASLGVLFTYIFVHLLFPVIFPTLPPAKREAFLPLQRFVNTILGSGGRYKPHIALVLFACMLLIAKPDFRVDLASMNTVSSDTLEAEGLVRRTWGDVLNKIYLMTEAGSVEQLQDKGDRLAEKLDENMETGALSNAFVPSMIFPGKALMKKNLNAWARFWSADRIAALKNSMRDAGRRIGFARDAFEPFFKTIARRNFNSKAIPRRYYDILSIQKPTSGTTWRQFSVLTPGRSYNPERFYSVIRASGLGRLFDPGLFSERLGAILMNGFFKMAAIIGAVTILVALLYLLNLRLTLIAMAPTLFSLVCTFGTLKLLHQQPGIPSIIVTVIVIGMGTDYALYIVRAYQRYMQESHPSLGLIRMSVFLSAVSTMIGFGALSFAGHALLRSAGQTLLLGIGYSFIGTALIVPPLLRGFFSPVPLPPEDFLPGSDRHAARARWRYRFMEPYPRFFAYFKMRYDPMFSELHELIPPSKKVIDVGTGYGVPASWLLELFPDARVYGIEPDENRRRIAEAAIGGRGTVTPGSAPDIPAIPGKADTVLVIDMVHYLTNPDLELLLQRLRKNISIGGRLVMRATVPRKKSPTFLRLIEKIWIRFNGLAVRYRTVGEISLALKQAGFAVTVRDSSYRNREEKWFVCKPSQKVLTKGA